MAYVPHVWVNLGGPKLEADELNDIENGLVDHDTRLDTVESTLVSRGTRLDTAEGNIVSLDNRLDIAEPKITTLEAAQNIRTSNFQTVSYTLVLLDRGKVIEMNSASVMDLTVPPNSSVAFLIGTYIEVIRLGAGQVTIVAGAGVTLRNPGTALTTRAQYSTIGLRKRNTDEWVLYGGVTGGP